MAVLLVCSGVSTCSWSILERMILAEIRCEKPVERIAWKQGSERAWEGGEGAERARPVGRSREARGGAEAGGVAGVAGWSASPVC